MDAKVPTFHQVHREVSVASSVGSDITVAKWQRSDQDSLTDLSTEVSSQSSHIDHWKQCSHAQNDQTAIDKKSLKSNPPSSLVDLLNVDQLAPAPTNQPPNGTFERMEPSDKAEAEKLMDNVISQMRQVVKSHGPHKRWEALIDKVVGLDRSHLLLVPSSGPKRTDDVFFFFEQIQTTLEKVEKENNEMLLDEIDFTVQSLEELVRQQTQPKTPLRNKAQRLEEPSDTPKSMPRLQKKERTHRLLPSRPVAPGFDQMMGAATQKLNFLRLQLAVNLESIEKMRRFGQESRPPSIKVEQENGDLRLEQILSKARETRNRLAKESPEVWEPLPDHDPNQDLSCVFKRHTPASVGFGVGVGVGTAEDFLDNEEDVEKLKNWLQLELNRQSFEDHTNEAETESALPLRSTMSLLSMYSGLSRSVSQWGEEVPPQKLFDSSTTSKPKKHRTQNVPKLGNTDKSNGSPMLQRWRKDGLTSNAERHPNSEEEIQDFDELSPQMRISRFGEVYYHVTSKFAT